MNDDNTGWVKTWVEKYSKDGADLSPREIEKAAIIGNAAFRGQMGVGEAAKAGVEAVKKLR